MENIELDIIVEENQENNKNIVPYTHKFQTHLDYWDCEDETFWKLFGRNIANKNLWISIPNLLLGFATWLVWSVMIIRLQTIHDKDNSLFAFKKWGNLTNEEYKNLLFVLPAIAGLSGATLRMTNTFMISVAGGPVTTSMTSLLFLVSMTSMGISLLNPNVTFYILILCAVLSGAGGGAFSSSMNNISYFFPKYKQGFALGLNAGIGNLGVSISQLLIPIMMDSVNIIGKEYTTENISPQNAGFFWFPFIIISMILAWFGLNSLPNQDVKNKMKDIIGYWWLEIIGYIGASIATVVFIVTREGMTNPGLKILQTFIVILIAIGVTMLILRYCTSFEFLGNTNQKLRSDFKMFKNKHTWFMTYLYMMTFGSFIGYSSVFPKLIQDVFGYDSNGFELTNAPDPTKYAWLGAFLGSIFRPFGGWLGDKYGGARVTSWAILITTLATVGVGFVIIEGKRGDTPENMFYPFLFLFLLMFITTGIGNGSTFKMAAVIFDNEIRGPVLGWISAIAAYGAFIFPIIFGISIKEDFIEWAMFGFATYYLSCFLMNWWYYYRKNCEIKC